MSRGGKREGAGRKRRSEPLVAITLKVDPPVADAWDAKKSATGLSGPALLAKFLGVGAGMKKPRTKKGKNAGISDKRP